MKAWQTRYLLLALTALLVLLWTRSSYGADMPDVRLIRVPPGWKAESEGYYLNYEALASLTAAARTYRLERDAWTQAYYELKEEGDAFADSQIAKLRKLESQILQEQRQYRLALKRARAPGFGVFAGAGMTSGGRVDAVVGVGIVWRLW